jgi:hypothetical protein
MLRRRCNIVKDKIYHLARDIALTSSEVSLEGLQREVEEINDQIDEYRAKKFVNAKYRNRIQKVVYIVNNLNPIYEHLKMISIMDSKYELSRSNCEEFCDVFKCNRKYTSYNESTDNIVFNHHYEEILIGIKRINNLLDR